MIRDISTRLYTAIFFTFFVIGSLMLSQWTYTFLFLLISVLCGYEFYKIVFDTKVKLRFILALMNCFMPIVFGIILRFYNFDIDQEILIGGLVCWTLMILASELLSPTQNPIQKTSLSLFALIYIGFPCLFAFELGFIHGTFSYLPLLGIFPLIWANDTGAYLVGSTLGKRQLFPSVSPKKTVEGTLGGIIITMLLSYPMSLINSAYTFEGWLVVTFIVGFCGTIGDLIESKFKRNYNIKDTGTFLPGHGGFLDRFDSFIFIISFVYLYSKFTTI